MKKGRDFKTLTFEGLMGKLKAFEVQSIMKYEEDHPQRASTEAKAIEKKAIQGGKERCFQKFKIWKATKEDYSDDSEDSSEDEIALMTHTFKKYLKHNKRNWESLGKQKDD